MRIRTLLLAVFGVVSLTTAAQEPTPLTRERYPQTWERTIQPGTALAQIKEAYETRGPVRMLATELRDVAPWPFWFCAYLRDDLPDSPTAGSYQYPGVAEHVFESMLQ